MKKILSLLIVTIFAAIGAFGQLQPAPGVFNYQGVARNSVGNVLANQTISLRLTIRDASPGGAIVYQETRTVITNPFGLFNVQVGSPGATGVSGSIQPLTGGLVTPSPWATATGLKYIQVEIDPAGGTTFINIGTAQIASVPFALYSSLSNDLVLPYNKTQADAGTLFRIVNSGTGVSGSIMGVTNSGAANAWGVHGRVDNPAAGAFSSGILGTNLSTTGNGIGVMGTQNGSGWGVYGTVPSGIGIYGLTTSGTGVQGTSTSGNGVQGISTSGIGVYGTSNTGNAGRFENTNAANGADALQATTNGAASSWALRATSTGLQGAGIFVYNNAAGTANALRVTNNGSGAAVSATASGTGNAGLFTNTNAANNASTVSISTNGTSATALSLSGPGIWGSAMGITNTTSGMEWRTSVNGTTYTVTKIPGSTFSPLQLFSTGGLDFSASSGTSIMRLLDNGDVGIGTVTPFSRLTVVQNNSGVNLGGGVNTGSEIKFLNSGTSHMSIYNRGNNALTFAQTSALSQTDVLGTPLMTLTSIGRLGIGTTTPATTLHIAGNMNLTDGTQALNRILRSDAAGNASWVDPSGIGVVTGSGTVNFVPKWTPSGTNLGNSLLFDNGTSMGLGTTTPSHRFDVTHGGSTGIGVNSTSGFSVVDINAASGDAALRFANAGVNQWNMRNRPSDNYLEIFELGGGGSRMVIQDATGNVGIGQTVSPSYKLDVLHGGSTGLRVQSTSSFSVVDIDAASGDAALRFANAGVNQWNMRNRPADDYFEIFELGGGGSRMVIQDGTGNVGIGATVSPSYKLDVEHGGSTGLRVLSTSSFSVIDIDGNSGDAALRFVKAGVNKWNTRNEPVNDDYQWFELGGGGERMRIQRGSGNIGINQPAPSYKLDVLHGGSTGLRVQSSASFSVIDIDAASGDAALRFQKAGVNKWNTRNEPVNDDYQWFELGGGGERMRIQRGTGNLGINQPSPTARLDVNGTFKLTDGTEGANKVLTSDAAGNASWQTFSGALTMFSSAWLGPFDPPSRDTSIDGTLTKVYFVLAPEITPAVLATGNISVYFRVGSIGPYELPYISNAGGRANAIQAFFQPGKIGITRPTFNETAPNNINLPGTLEFRYTIIQ
jgi:hypothetical protein